MPGSLYNYAQNEKKIVDLKINNETEEAKIVDGYIVIEKRNWSSDDIIEVEFGMSIRKVISNEKLKSNKGKIAYEYGPIVYCAEEADNPKGVLDVKISNEYSSNFEFDNYLFDGIGKILLTNKKSEDKKLTLIPYYSWANREVGEMAVWLDHN